MEQIETVRFTLTEEDITNALTNFVNAQQKSKHSFEFSGWVKKSGQQIEVVAEIQ